MPRPKKDSTKVCLNVNIALWERLRVYADLKGQTLTTALERLLSKALDEAEKQVETTQRG